MKVIKFSQIFFALPLASLTIFSSTHPVAGQLIPDSTLGPESSTLTPNITIKGIPSDQINGGAIRGHNLFHSFQEFNISEGRAVYFANPANIENILTRVTGHNSSNIWGTLGVLGNANLFLMNPNGIFFGPKARLDVGGSFFATSASSLIFRNGGGFSAVDPQSPPLLAVNIPIGLQFRENPGEIINQSQARNSQNLVVGLQVPFEKNLTLVGGNVRLQGGSLFAGGGRVELGGLSGAGTVNLNEDGSLNFPTGVQRGDVSLTDQAKVDVRVGNRGSMAITARNLELLEASQLLAGIMPGLGAVNSQAGDININTAGAVTVDAQSSIENSVQLRATGKGGDINLIVGSLAISNGSVLNASTYGQGDAGSIRINAGGLVFFDGVGRNGQSSGVFSAVASGAIGSGGGVDIRARSLFLTNGGVVSASTFGQGNAGIIRIHASDTVSVDGVASNGQSSGVFSAVVSGAIGNAGGIDITARSLSVTNGGVLNASTYGRGDAGSVRIEATDAVSVDGVGRNGQSSGVFSTVVQKAIGNGGGVDITARSLSLTNGAQLTASTFGQGNAGSVRINATDTVSLNQANAFSTVEKGAIGSGGSIEITTGSLFVNNGAQLQTQTKEQGDAGIIRINATDTVSLDGVGRNGNPSAAFSDVAQGAIGNAGGVDITARSL
ncbi:MAG: filamentous hemagglutinin N-terminal domain-containing protein, partial [Actinomycetota bacterium]